MDCTVAAHGVLQASLILCCKTCGTHSWLCVCQIVCSFNYSLMSFMKFTWAQWYHSESVVWDLSKWLFRVNGLFLSKSGANEIDIALYYCLLFVNLRDLLICFMYLHVVCWYKHLSGYVTNMNALLQVQVPVQVSKSQGPYYNQFSSKINNNNIIFHKS